MTASSFILFGSASPSPSLMSFAVFCAGAGALGWVGLYMLLSAELGGPKHAGFMTGVGVAFLLAGILLGGPVFGLVLEATDSYSISWSTFALISGGIGAAVWATAGAIHRECVNRTTPTSITAGETP
jgi:predicted MFS family arabinose efflux permease